MLECDYNFMLQGVTLLLGWQESNFGYLSWNKTQFFAYKNEL